MNEPAARRTPYELVFSASDEFEATVFPRIQEEARERDVDPLQPERFGFLSLAADAVRSLISPDAPPEALDQYRALVFQAFNFWRFGKRTYALEQPLARYLVEGAPSLADWELALPYPSIYLQLPANLFWGSVSADSTPEPVDGFFAAEARGEDATGGERRSLEVLAVLGVRRDRAGFSVIPFSTEAGPRTASIWSEAPGRETGADFQNVLPGGEMSGLYSILTTTEVLKILTRSLWYISRYPADVMLEANPDPPGQIAEDAPPAPRLEYHRVRLGGGEAAEG
jgi:hypothetical protein